MRMLPFFLSAAITAGLIFILNIPLGDTIPMPLGKFLSPQHGFWQNAEATDQDFTVDLHFPELRGKTEVYFDERLVPHIFASVETDAYFVQGYLHAKFRLWQMEFQTHATAGRISEIVGEKAINYDREQRRMGLGFGAENMLREIEKNEITRNAVNSYTAGVNAYISSLSESQLPIEYKLLNYQPEKWTNLKTALFIKQMTKTLAGYGYANDFQYTNLRSVFSEEEMKWLFPYAEDSLSPIIPKGTLYPAPGSLAIPRHLFDSAANYKTDTVRITSTDKPTPGIGSNNWAVSGSRTQSGSPILCNDPHLDLTLPSIWYELQIHTPAYNAYGVSFPGLPGVVIGFNDSIAFGFTNGGIDIMDFYEIRFRDDSRKQYWFNGQWTDCKDLRVEEIKVKGGRTVYDTVAYTVFGPVMYDKSFTHVSSEGKAIAIRWKAHDPSNELLMWWKLNRANNYEDYEKALPDFTCPVQNVVFACKRGDIAIWQQGQVPLRWTGQGVYLMPGEDSSYSWQGMIPQNENPHILNPERGFVSSANQRATDTSYPYFVPGDYAVYRGYRINQRLAAMQQVTPADMMKLQNDNFNTEASLVRPVLLQKIDAGRLNADEIKLLEIFRAWNLENNPDQKAPAIFEAWMDSLMLETLGDEFSKTKDPLYPDRSTLIDRLIGDSVFHFADNILTPRVETVPDIITASFKKAAPGLLEYEKAGRLDWDHVKNTTIYHLLRSNALAFARKGIRTGGGNEIINATRHNNGPSWRMVVQLSTPTEAWGVYPGGQSGNPGSRYYDSFIDDWASGKYYKLWFMREGDKTDQKVQWVMKFGSGEL